MKKAVTLLLCLICTVLLFSCGGTPRITGEDWTLASATHLGEVLYVSEDLASQAPSATVVDCTLKARGGKLTLSDKTSGESYAGTYEKRANPGPTTADHLITLEGKQGRILLSRVALGEGEDTVPSLTLSVDDYVLYFIAK